MMLKMLHCYDLKWFHGVELYVEVMSTVASKKLK